MLKNQEPKTFLMVKDLINSSDIWKQKKDAGSGYLHIVITPDKEIKAQNSKRKT